MSERALKTRPRVSLLSLLLLVAVAALGMATFLLWRELAPLRAEVQQLRAETGRLTIRDPSKVHAIQVETGDDNEWKWRVRVPAGKRYMFKRRSDNVPGSGFPSLVGGSGPLTEGEYVITYSIRQDSETEEWRGRFVVRRVGDDDNVGVVLSGGAGPFGWLDWGTRTSMFGGVGFKTEAFEPGQPITLYRLRVGKTEVGSGKDELRPGFMFWLIPAS